MFKAIVGQSEDPLAAEAVRDIVAQIKTELPEGMLPQAGIMYCSIDMDHAEVLSRLNDEFPAMDLIGGTTDGEFSSRLGFKNDSVALMVFVSDSVEIKAGAGHNASKSSAAAGREATIAANDRLQKQKDHAQVAIIVSDPANAGVADFDKGIYDVLGEAFPVFGGAAAAHSKGRKTFQFCNGQVFSEGIAMLLFAGPVTYSFGIKGGHDPLSPKDKVTKAEGNVLFRIGERRAFDYFKHYIGEYDLFMNYCLAVYPEDSEQFFVRSAPFSDAEKGTVTLNGNIPKNASVQIGTADKDRVIDSCHSSLVQAKNGFPGGNFAAALLFSCAGRKFIMGSQIHKETAEVCNQLPGTPFAGFYCYGEFGPLQRGEGYLFHGTTFVTVLIGESQS